MARGVGRGGSTPRSIEDSVVVITGASSGIGRAAALDFARRGATVVLAARRGAPLREVAVECERLGARALAVPTDVADEAAVQALAQRAIKVYGRIDVWINNAAVAIFGRFEETPPEVYRQVLETNLFGYIHGARAALKRFREQGSGVLINVASIVANAPQPYTSAYVVSKHGIRALGMSLRQELSLDPGHDIHVSTILPATIDTPLFQNAANYTGRAVKPMSPVYPPEQVVEAIVACARHPRREVLVGGSARMLTAQSRLAPALNERMMARVVENQHLDKDKSAPPSAGNVLEPQAISGVTGGWLPPEVLQRRRRLQRGAVAGAIAGATILGAWWLRRPPRASRGIDGANGSAPPGPAGLPRSTAPALATAGGAVPT